MKGIFRVKKDGSLFNTPIVSAGTSDECWKKFNERKNSLQYPDTTLFKCTDLNFQD